jgi:hypothetical protein
VNGILVFGPDGVCSPKFVTFGQRVRLDVLNVSNEMKEINMLRATHIWNARGYCQVCGIHVSEAGRSDCREQTDTQEMGSVWPETFVVETCTRGLQGSQTWPLGYTRFPCVAILVWGCSSLSRMGLVGLLY